MYTDEYLRKIFLNKKEIIDSFEEILPPPDVEVLKNTTGLAIGEVAGKDSVAAIIAASGREDIKSILPVAIYTGTLYGDWNTIFETARYIQREVKKRHKKEVHHLTVMGSPRLWHALNGRFMHVLSEKFGFFSPCLGCHLYFHSIVIPLAKELNTTLVIAGERESHEGRIKLNQTKIATDAYVSMMKDFGIELILPVRYIEDDAEIASIIGKDWKDDDQMACVLSGNYKSVDGSVSYTESQSYDFFHRYAIPAASEIMKGILAKEKLDYPRIVRHILDKIQTKEL